MLKHKLALLFRIHKVKLLVGVIILLLIILVLKQGKSQLLQIEDVVVPYKTTTVETTNLFAQSAPYVLQGGLPGLNKVTYKVDESGNKTTSDIKVITETREQKELQGTSDFNQYKVDIQNLVSTYISSIQSQNWTSAVSTYVSWTKVSPEATDYNYTNSFKILNNPLITSVIPLYDHVSSKAIVKTTLAGSFQDMVTGKTLTQWDVYSIWDGNGFKLFNPEYLNAGIKVVNQNKLIQGTNINKSHYVNLQLEQLLVNFPNKLYFNITAKTTENVLFNKIKVTVYNNKTREIYYQGTEVYNDVSEKAEWKRTIFMGKSGYRTNFWTHIEFDKFVYSTIYDKMYVNDKFNLDDISVAFKPMNDTDVYLEYSDYIFNLSGTPSVETDTVPKKGDVAPTEKTETGSTITN